MKHDGEMRLKVVVVDDNHDAADSLAILTSAWGHETRAAYDGTAALSLVCESCPDVMLVDIAMPGVSGNDLARAVREMCPTTTPALIAVSGYGDASHRQQAIEAGFDHFFIKPLDLDGLKRLLLLQMETALLARQARSFAEEHRRLAAKGSELATALRQELQKFPPRHTEP